MFLHFAHNFRYTIIVTSGDNYVRDYDRHTSDIIFGIKSQIKSDII